MTVGTLIKRLSNYHVDYVVKLHHREEGRSPVQSVLCRTYSGCIGDGECL